MTITTVTVYVKPEYLDEFIAITTENHKDLVKEPGNMREEMNQCPNELSMG